MLLSLSSIHRRIRPVLPLFIFVLIGPAAPGLFAVPATPARTNAAENRQFVEDLARAERKHDYHLLLIECDQRVATRPDDRESYRRRALARWGARRYDGALADFSHAIDLARRQHAPARMVAIMNYGRALIRREQHDTAAEATELERTAHADRSFTDALNDLAWIRATNPDAALRNGRQAVSLAHQACKTVPDSVKYLDTLAAAYAEAGDAKRATDSEHAAIKAAHNDARTAGQYKDFLAGAPGRAEMYASGERYRDIPGHPGAPANPAVVAGPSH